VNPPPRSPPAPTRWRILVRPHHRSARHPPTRCHPGRAPRSSSRPRPRHPIPPRGKHPRRARPLYTGRQPNRGTSDEHHRSSQRRRRGPRCLPRRRSPVGDGSLLHQPTQAVIRDDTQVRGAPPARWCRAARSTRRSGASRPYHAPRDTPASPHHQHCAAPAPVGTVGRDDRRSAGLALSPGHWQHGSDGPSPSLSGSYASRGHRRRFRAHHA